MLHSEPSCKSNIENVWVGCNSLINNIAPYNKSYSTKLDLDSKINYSTGAINSSSSSYTTNSFSSDLSTLQVSLNPDEDSFDNDVLEPVNDWFSLNLYDPEIEDLTRSFYSDGQISRNEMIEILRSAEDSSIVDRDEFEDFQTLVNHADYLGMADYVRVLSNHVVNGNAANQSYQGSALGTLSVGSSATQLEDLVDKWFLGTDYPLAQNESGTETYTYEYASGSLFQDGISYQDVNQGTVGDCYFLAGLAETAQNLPDMIQSMFIDNGDGTYTVRFYNQGVAEYVTVDRYLPTFSWGDFAYAEMGDLYSDPSNELWVALAEKAYAQLNQSGWIHQDNTNSYQGISGGFIGDAFEHITGQEATIGNALDFTAIVNASNVGQLIGFASNSSQVDSNIVPEHAYTLVDYQASTQEFTLFNPWGMETVNYYDGYPVDGLVTLTWQQLTENFVYWDSTIG